MKREQYTNQQNHSSFQPQSVTSQSALEHNQLNQPTQHSSAIADSNRSNWLNKANQWVNDKVHAAQSFVNGGGAIAADDILPALQSGSQSQATQSNQAIVGIIDSGFGANDHGTQMLDTIRDVNPEASVVLKEGVGQGGWAESLTEFVDTAKASGQTGAVANLSFDLTETRPDGTVTTRSQLTAEEQSALAYARDNNVLVVASAGNEGGAMSALGQASEQFENVIAVGAAEGNGRADYSSFGPGLDLVANGSKHGKEGTSFAAAEVTGAISEIWEANPHLSARQVSQTLQATATDLHTPGWDAETGAGKLNLDRARSVAQQITPDTQSFSGADLLHQTQGSFDGATWQSKNGSVASERSNFLGMKLPSPPKPKDLGKAIAQKGRDFGNAVKREVRETKAAATQKGR
ncbi:MAG: S8/S53 family peptidase, partial [Oscillatoriales cyanobacterium C42_A2020_001]|nr:S8/S53 family peptidase [Leptolyngbyaceae cyanobacterium C42_A2020_001]